MKIHHPTNNRKNLLFTCGTGAVFGGIRTSYFWVSQQLGEELIILDRGLLAAAKRKCIIFRFEHDINFKPAVV
jgi:hypothetical protein